MPVLNALSYAHKTTIHCDLKPENIMIVGELPKPGIEVLDFGLTRALSPSRSGQKRHALGTGYYIAPEDMVGSADIDPPTDLYSVGMILYEILTGKMAVGAFDLPSRHNAELPRGTG